MKQSNLTQNLFWIFLFMLSESYSTAQKNEIELDLNATRFSIVSDSTDFQYSSTLLEINEYLDEREVVKVLKDDTGLLWIIQRQVVHSFDGNSILESHYLDQQNQEVIEAFFKQNLLILINKDSSFIILDIENKQNDNIRHYDFPKHHSLFSVFDNNLFSLVDIEQDKKIIYKADFSIASNFKWVEQKTITSTNKITTFHYDEPSQDVLFITEEDDIIHITKTGSIIFNPKKSNEVFIPKSKIIKYKEGYFIFFNHAHGIYWYDNNRNTSNDRERLFPLSSKGIYAHHSYDQNGSLLIGLEIIPKIVNTVLQVTGSTIKFKNHDLEFNTTFHVLSENFNREQILSGGNGIYRVSNNEEIVPGIKRYLHDPLKTTVEYGEIITDIKEHQKEVYAVSESGRSVYMYSNNKFETIYKNENLLFHKLSSDTLNSILWISAFNEKRHGSLFALENSKIRKIVDTDIIIRKVISTEKNKILLFGFRHLGRQKIGVIYSFNIIDGSLKEIFSREGFDIWCAAKINDKILCGTNHTLFEFNSKSYNIKVIDELNSEMISAIRQYNDTIFICTRSNGIYLLNRSYDVIKHLDFSREAVSNKVTDIIRDEKQNYWISTFRGIALLNQNFKYLMRFTHRDGLSAWEFNSFASTSCNNNIYFGSINGITKIDTREFYQRADNAAKIYNVKANYKNKVHSPLSKENSFTFEFIPDNIMFESYFQNVVSSLPNYSSIEVYYDNEIIPIEQTKHLVKISNLSKGAYEVYQRNLMNEKVKLAKINISTNYSVLIRNILLAACIALLGFLFARFINYRERKLLVEKNELENRLVEIKLESLRSQLNPHFVFNCLNSIQYYIQMNEKVLARDYLSKFSKLMRYFLESSRNDKITISEEINLLTLYLDLEKLRFENKFDYNISNSIQEDYKIPTMILQPHVENSIVHGISYLEERKGKIDISFVSVNNGVTCSIVDNGIGRKAATMIKENKQTKHKSRATQIIKERMDILNNQGKGNTQIRYQDKKDKNGKISGTIADITFVTY